MRPAGEDRVPAGRSGPCRSGSVPVPLVPLVAEHVAEPAYAIAQKKQRAGIDKVGEENAVAGRHLRPNRFHRMPGVGADGESITGVGDEAHLRMLVEAAVRLALVEDRADVADAVVRRQIELYGDAFP